MGIQTQHITPSRSRFETLTTKTAAKMRKSLLVFGTFLFVIVFLSAETSGKKRSSTFLQRLCKKCEYCVEDPMCDGCNQCGDCFTGENGGVGKAGCKFCKEGEAESKCRERCNKGCKICQGKDGSGLDSCNRI